MNEEEFITKFYSCDDEEQFLKDVYHNLNCLQQENQQLKIQISAREEICNRLENNWNKLKEYCKENTLCYEVGDDENTKLIGSKIHGLNVLNKMQELEQGSDSNGNN